MITSLKLLTMFSGAHMILAKNPLKSASWLLAFSTSNFAIMNLFLGSSWYPMIFLMMFMGGVMILLMTLASIMPNEKAGKNSKSNLTLLLAICVMALMGSFLESPHASHQSLSLKIVLASAPEIYLALTLIILYFFYFISILSNDSTPMRAS